MKKRMSKLFCAVMLVVTMGLGTACGNMGAENKELSLPTFTDEDGKKYVVAFLKELSDSEIKVDVIDYITDDNMEKVNELRLSQDDMPDGYYFHNPDTETINWKLNAQTVYHFIDWSGDFSDAGNYPREYTTTDVKEFKKYIETYDNATPGMPFFFEVEKGVVSLIVEKPFA